MDQFSKAPVQYSELYPRGEEDVRSQLHLQSFGSAHVNLSNIAGFSELSVRQRTCLELLAEAAKSLHQRHLMAAHSALLALYVCDQFSYRPFMRPRSPSESPEMHSSENNQPSPSPGVSSSEEPESPESKSSDMELPRYRFRYRSRFLYRVRARGLQYATTPYTARPTLRLNYIRRRIDFDECEEVDDDVQ